MNNNANEPNKTNEPNKATELRLRAEDISQREAREKSHDMAWELHELRVHQIELEIQNEELQRAQSELDFERARYFDLYNLAPVGYVTISERGLILEANLTTAALLGLARGALVNQPFPRFILKEDQGIYYQCRKSLFDTGAAQVCDLRLLKTDAAQRFVWVHLDLTIVQGADGEPVCLAALSVITERKQIEAELRESKTFNLSILNSVTAEIAVLDHDGVILAVNESWQRFAVENGTEPGKPAAHTEVGVNYLAVCKTDTSFASDDGALTAQQGIQAVLDGSLSSFSLEYPCHSMEQQRWFNMSVTPLGQGGDLLRKPGAVVAHTNITERKLAEEALRESEEKYRLIAENTSDGIIIFGADHRIQYVSPAYHKQLGYSETEELLRNPESINSLIHPDERETIFSNIFEAIRLAKSGLTYSYRAKHKAGHYIWREDNATFQYDNSGNYRGAYVICRDVTARKLAEAKRDNQLVFATALNEIAQVIISKDNPEDILEGANQIIGETLQLDRILIYDVSFEKNIVTGLCEWRKQEHPDIAPTKDVYPLDMFLSSFTEIRKSKHYLESHFDAINQHFIQDGSGKILHEQMKIKSLMWYPFAFYEHGYYIFTLNQIMYQRLWTPEDIAFLNSVAKQINLALIKMKLLEEKKASTESLRVSEEKHRLITKMQQGVAVYEIILDQAGKPVDYRFLEINESYERLTGLKRENIIGKTVLEILPDTETDVMNKYGQVAMTGEPLQYGNYVKELGKYFEVVVYSPLPEQIAVIISDISKRKQAEAALHESQELFSKFMQYSPIYSFIHAVTPTESLVLHSSDNYKDMIGISGRDMVGKTISELFPPEFAAKISAVDWAVVTNGKVVTVDEELKGRHYTSIKFPIVQGEKTLLAGYTIDITERKHAENQLRQLSRAVEHSPTSIIITDPDGKIEYVNPKFIVLTGYSLEEVRGQTPRILKSGQTPPEVYLDLWQTILAGKEWRGELLNRKKDGKLYWEFASISTITDPQGSITHFVGLQEDITARKSAEEEIRLLNAELEKLALTDYLTNLYNRRYFMQRGAEEIKRARRNSQPLALLMLDIDEFKKVNDRYGHEAGDLALQQVAAVMKSSLREIDLLGRLGGEEFAALLPNTSVEDAVLSAERVRQTIANTSSELPGQVLSKPITVSVGVAMITAEVSSVGDLLKKADAALYRAKYNGRNCIVVYQENPDVTRPSERPDLSG